MRSDITTLDNLPERFWSKVDMRSPDECWEWRAGRCHLGYGRFRLRNGLVPGAPRSPTQPGRSHTATRVAWFLTHGAWPQLDMCHGCDNPPCVNPSHLWEGTHAENMRDMAQKGRSNVPGLRGEAHPSCKLSDAQVGEIIARAAAGEMKAALAREFGVSKSSVSRWTLGQKRQAA